MEKQEEMKTREDVLDFVRGYIWYRGGMGNRIDAFDIRDFLEGERKRDFKKIMKVWNKAKEVVEL